MLMAASNGPVMLPPFELPRRPQGAFLHQRHITSDATKEFNAEVRRDLLQEIHLQLWRSFAHFDGRCSLRTWVYRVAHNVATGHIIRQRRTRERLVSIEAIEAVPGKHERADQALTQAEALDRLSLLIQRLKPLDRQIIVSYLEGMDASSIGELTGLAPANIAVKIHRIKNILRRWFQEGGPHAK